MAAATWRERLHRWRWWLIAGAVLLVVRAALPEVLRRVIISQASQALNARVDVGDVDLSLWRGGVALEDVAVRAKGAPTPPPPPKDLPKDAPPPPAFDAYSPIIGFKRFAVELHYLPLFSKTIQLRDIEFEAPRVALDRLATGDLNVMALVPKQQVAVEAGGTPGAVASPTAATPAGESSPWSFGLDTFILTDGRIRFRDLALEGAEPVELGIDRISVNQIALTPSVYGKPATINLKLGVDEGTIDVKADLTLDGSKVSVTTDVTAEKLPLRRARLYVPKVGWSDLEGELDLALTYELVPEQTNALHGTIGLHDVSVAVPSLKDVAVGWKSLGVSLERIDLINQRADVQEVTLDGAVVALHAEGGQLLPALAPGVAAAAATPEATPPGEAATAAPDAAAPAEPEPTGDSTATGDAEPTATPSAAEPSPTSSAAETAVAVEGEASPTPTETPGEGTSAAQESPPPAEATPPPKPWGWQVAVIKITDSKLRVVGDLPTVDVGLTLDAAKLTGDADAIGHVALGVALESGTVTLDGDVRIAPSPAFGGTLKIADLPLPKMPVVRRILPSDAFPSGNLRSDLVITAGLPAAAGGQAAADRLGISGTLGLAALKLLPPQAPGLSLDLSDLELRLDRLVVPGVIPLGEKASAGAAIDVAASLTLRDPHVVRSGDQPLDVAAQSLVLTLPSVTVPAALAKLGPGDSVAIVTGDVGLDLGAPRVTMGEAMAFQADTVALRVTDAKLPVLNAPPAVAPVPIEPAGEGAPTPAIEAAPAAPPGVSVAAPPATLDLKLDVAAAKFTTAQGKELDAGIQTVALQLTDITVPGFVAGAPMAASTEPLQAKGTLALTQTRVARADGKEFAISAKSISVPLQSLALPGVPGGLPPGAAAQPLRASFGEIRLEAPAIRVTRTKDGIVLPATGPTAEPGKGPAPPTPAAPPAVSPSATPGPQMALQIAALRILRGGLDFTDRAVEPPASIQFAPIEVDARNISLPGPKVKPLKIDISSTEQGKISVRGDLDPDGSHLELKVDELALAPFNSYATTYSSYGIADGALTIDVKADGKGGQYTITNDIRLHQFDLSGAEGDSLFEQNFGVPLSLALALLRDIQGNIDLNVPMQIDREGKTQIDLMAVVRSALKQALAGAITSPLKMLGAVAGGSGAPIAPQPIAFRLGRAEPTGPGAESATRLAAFLASRPAMGVTLASAATPDDARWLHEHALLATWAEEGFFERSLAFVTERGPRERIRAYLEARVEDQKPELSAEDAATLDEWLKEIPEPTPEALQSLADARVAAVESVLHDKGIDASRISRGEAPAAATKPIVGIHLRTAKSPEDQE